MDEIVNIDLLKRDMNLPICKINNFSNEKWEMKKEKL